MVVNHGNHVASADADVVAPDTVVVYDAVVVPNAVVVAASDVDVVSDAVVVTYTDFVVAVCLLMALGSVPSNEEVDLVVTDL